MWGLFFLALWSTPAHALLARVSEAHLQAPQRVVRLSSPKPGTSSIWVQFYSKDFRQAVNTLKESLTSFPNTHVEIQSFYRATGEARLSVPEESVDEVLEALVDSDKIKLAGPAQKMRISEMKGPSDR